MKFARHYRWARSTALILAAFLVVTGAPIYELVGVVVVCLAVPFVADAVCR